MKQLPNRALNLITYHPAKILAVALALITAINEFGLMDITTSQTAAITNLIAVIIVLIANLFPYPPATAAPSTLGNEADQALLNSHHGQGP